MSRVRTGTATLSSRRRVDGVEIDAAIQDDEHAVNLISTQAATSLQSPYCGRDDCARLAKACAVDMPEHISDMLVERISESCGVIVDFERFSACLLYTSPSPRDRQKSRMPSSA